jgi:predicted RNA methylase
MDLTEVPGTSLCRHPWEIARARFFGRVLADAGRLAAPWTVLDVGAGDGYLARTLLAASPAGSRVVCLDPNYSDDDLRRFALRRSTASASFDSGPRSASTSSSCST